MAPFSKSTFPRFAFPKGGSVRAAGVTEAMIRLRDRQVAAYARWAEASRSAAEATTADPAEILDMVAPSAPGGAWRAPGIAEAGADVPPRPARDGEIADGAMRTVREALAKAGIGTDPVQARGGAGRGARPAQAPLPDGARFETRTFSNAAGTRTYKVYVPSGFTGQPLPVVVMLHGCTQDPDDFAAGTRMNAVAEEHGFLVVYPEQPRSAHMQRCWNWYEPRSQRREGGEAALIAGLTRQVATDFSADLGRIYAAGLSAGGAAAAILATTHPDLFAAIGVHSGLACGSARDVPSAFAAMRGDGAGAAGPTHAVPLIVFHGDGDRTVHAANGARVAAQGQPDPEARTSVIEGRTPDGVAYTRTVRTDASGRAVAEHWVLHGAGHAWSGGSPAGSFTDPRGPDASREMIRFFLRHTRATAG